LAFHNRAYAWDRKGEHDRALADYSEAIHLDPNNAHAFYNRAGVWEAKREYDKALADYGEAIRLDPTFASAFFNRGTLWGRRRDHDKALADYDEAIRLDSKKTLAFIARGNTRVLKRQYDKALADYDEATRLDPKHAIPFNNRAWIWATCPDAMCRDGKRARESATRACELTRWQDAYSVGTLAAAHAEEGDFAKAVEYQRKANELFTDPDERAKGDHRLALYQSGKPCRDE
jgi:tetratricopeptide (TPR) repeat protein